ncbi:MAG: O-antigen ligase family protein [Bacteroidales bacterium]|nr:O-antigen ligase family protein [Bacteroidales bacterium]MEE0993199.1 O-antigen ligase family protein [Bacteroidales bacterium]
MKAFDLADKLIEKTKSVFNSFFDRFSDNTITYFCVGLCCALFIAGGVYCLNYEYYIYALIPVILFGILFVVKQFKNTFLLIALLTPLAVNMSFKEVAISIPSEPILILVFLLFLWERFFTGKYEGKVLSHPISIAIIINLVWTLITCFTSEDMLVSFKYLLSQLWFIIPCFYLPIVLFKNTRKIDAFVGFYSLSLCIVICIATANFASHGFAFNFAHYSMQPFYNDHTAYGAAIALLIPPIAYYLIYGKDLGFGKGKMIFVITLLAILITGFVLSYSRAAWVSLCAAFGVWVLVKSNIKLKTLIYCGLVMCVVIAFSWGRIMGAFEKNDQDSSGNMAEHISSITNISTDASNVERLNRWACALDMFKERPVFGCGPGMYTFLYGAYQKSYNLSIISTDSGDLGSTHSEYLRPLSEQGLIGLLTNTAVFVVTFVIGIRAYRRTASKLLANLALFATMGLTTYYVHGFLNQFLETDKLAVPFWGLTAVVAAIDLYATKKEKQAEKDNEKQLLNSEK